MKNIITYILLLAILTQPLRQIGIIASFKIRQAEIAAKLCENLNKPELDCAGTCYLKKQLNDLQKEEQKLPDTIKKTEITWFYSPVFSLQIPYYQVVNQKIENNYFYKNRIAQGYSYAIFHPPSHSILA